MSQDYEPGCSLHINDCQFDMSREENVAKF